MIWKKDHFANGLLAKKAPVSHFEDILVFSKNINRYDRDRIDPIRPYAKQIFQHIALPKSKIFEIMGHQGACHFMRYDSEQFSLCTERTYDQLCDLFGISSLGWFIPFQELKAQSDLWRRDLIEKVSSQYPKTFNLPQGCKVKSNVLQYKKDRGGFHPTQKPVALMEDLVQTFSNPGNTVLDFTMGSGSTGVACINQGRDFIGIEKDPEFYRLAKERLDKALQAYKLQISTPESGKLF